MTILPSFLESLCTFLEIWQISCSSFKALHLFGSPHLETQLHLGYLQLTLFLKQCTFSSMSTRNLFLPLLLLITVKLPASSVISAADKDQEVNRHQQVCVDSESALLSIPLSQIKWTGFVTKRWKTNQSVSFLKLTGRRGQINLVNPVPVALVFEHDGPRQAP